MIVVWLHFYYLHQNGIVIAENSKLLVQNTRQRNSNVEQNWTISTTDELKKVNISHGNRK